MPTYSQEITTEAQAACSVIIDPQDSFKLCHAHMNVQAYYDNCVLDYSAEKFSNGTQLEQTLCSALEIVATVCAECYIDYVEWRKENRCPKICPANMVYTECATLCPTTCNNHYLINIDSASCKIGCSPGCVCEAGYHRDTHNNNTCTLEEDCGCIYRDKQYATGDEINVECNTW